MNDMFDQSKPPKPQDGAPAIERPSTELASMARSQADSAGGSSALTADQARATLAGSYPAQTTSADAAQKPDPQLSIEAVAQNGADSITAVGNAVRPAQAGAIAGMETDTITVSQPSAPLNPSSNAETAIMNGAKPDTSPGRQVGSHPSASLDAASLPNSANQPTALSRSQAGAQARVEEAQQAGRHMSELTGDNSGAPTGASPSADVPFGERVRPSTLGDAELRPGTSDQVEPQRGADTGEQADTPPSQQRVQHVGKQPGTLAGAATRRSSAHGPSPRRPASDTETSAIISNWPNLSQAEKQAYYERTKSAASRKKPRPSLDQHRAFITDCIKNKAAMRQVFRDLCAIDDRVLEDFGANGHRRFAAAVKLMVNQ